MYLIFQLIKNESKAVINEYGTNYCIRQIKFGLKHTLTIIKLNYKHVRLETSSKIGALNLILGLYCHMGATKESPSKNNRFEVKLNKHYTVNIGEALSSSTNLSRKNNSTHVIDIMFCEDIGCKV